MQRAIRAAMAVLLVQLVLVAFLYLVPEEEASGGRDGRLLSFSPDAVEIIRLTTGAGERLVLRRDESDWFIAGQEGPRIPADAGQAAELLDKLAHLRKGVAVATSSGAAERFEVDSEDFATLLELDDGSERLAAIYFGTGAGFEQIHARLAGSDAIYTVGLGGHEIAALIEQWIDRDVLRLDRNSFARMSFGDLVLVKTAEDGWRIEEAGGQAPPGDEEIDKLVEAVATIAVHGAAPGKSGNPSPAVLEFTTTLADGRILDWRFFESEESWYYLARSDYDLLFKVSGWQVEELETLLIGGGEEQDKAEVEPEG